MNTLISNILLACILGSPVTTAHAAPGEPAAVPAPTPPQQRPDRPAPGAGNPAALPAPAASAAMVSNTPQHAPDQLDFGQVLDGQSATRTFSLTTNASGYVTVSITPGAFRVAEFREMVAPQGLSKNIGGQLPVTGAVRSRIKYYEGQNGPYQWSMAPNSTVQIDVVFTPKAQQGGGALKTATMNVTGPGPRGNWALPVSLRGSLSPLNLTPLPPQPSSAPSIGSVVMSGKPGNASGSTPGSAAPTAPRAATSGPGMGGPGSVVAATNAASALTPIHSPDQFDFGEVWDEDFAKQTFHITATAYGRVEATLPSPFRISEFRLLVPISAGGKNPGNKSPNIVPQTFKRTVYKEDQPGPYTWMLEPGDEVQIDVVFQPHFDFGSMMAGLKTGAMKISGPGPMQKWTLTIPLRGMFDGKKITAPIVATQREIFAVDGDRQVTVPITIIGLGAPVSGTVRAGGQVPPGVSVKPTKVSVPAQKPLQTSVQLSLSGFSRDGVARPLELVFDDGSKSSKTQVDFTGLVNSIKFDSGGRGDCGVKIARLMVAVKLEVSQMEQQGPLDNQQRQDKQKQPSGNMQDKLKPGGMLLLMLPYVPQNDQQQQKVDAIASAGMKELAGNDGKYVFKGFNFDILSTRNVHMVLESGGVKAFERVFTLPTHNMDVVERTGSANVSLSRADWAKVLQGPARFGCQLGDLNGSPYTPMKWAPAAP